MCALHFQRNGTPRAYISTQAFNATSYGTQYELMGSYNIGSSICKVMQTQQVTLTILVEWTPSRFISLVMEQEEGLNQ
jgi:hypothetical protein